MKKKPCLSDDNIRRLSPDKRDEIIGKIVDEFSESDRVLSKWKQKLIRYYELYQMVQKKKHYDGLANIFVPEILRAVETIVGKLYGLIFAQPDWFEYSERVDDWDNGGAIALTALTKYQVEENNFKTRVMDSLRQMTICGLTVRKVCWDYDEVERTVPGRDAEGKQIRKKKLETIKDTWTFEPVDMLTFQMSDVNTPYNDLQKARWLGEQFTATKVFVDARTHKGWFSDVMQDKLSSEPKAASSTVDNNVRNKLQTSGFNQITNLNKYELMERWGLVPAEWVMTPEERVAENYDADDLVEAVVVIANKVAIIKLELNPFWHNQKPYVACPYIPKEGELPGIGAVQIGESLQEEINDTRNQTMDNKTLILATMWLRSKTSGIKNDSLRIRPNGIIDTMDMEGLEPLRPPMVTQVGASIEATAKNDLREGSGAASNLQGIAQSGVGTATESNQINVESMGRILMVAQLYSELVLKPTLVFAEFNNYQYYDHIKAMMVIGKLGAKFKKLTIDDIAGGHKNVIVRIDVDGTENPAIVRQQYMTFIGQTLQMPPQLIAFHWNALDKGYGMFFHGRSMDEIYPNPTPDPDKQLSKEEERDMVIARQPVKATKGQDHKAYLKYHEAEFASMHYGLDEEQFPIYKELIFSHYVMLKQEVEEQHQQMMQALAQQEQDGPKGGQSANSSPNTMTPAPSGASMTRALGQ